MRCIHKGSASEHTDTSRDAGRHSSEKNTAIEATETENLLKKALTGLLLALLLLPFPRPLTTLTLFLVSYWMHEQ